MGGAASAEDAYSYLSAKYPEQEVDRIIERLGSASSKRSVTICGACETHAGEDLLLSAQQDEMRLYDYLVDPIYSTASTACDAGISRVIGLSIEQFAPAVAALTDHEEMVLALVHPLMQV